MDNEKSFVMAKRLKELREGKNLSHVKLAKALKEQYGIEVSRDSLMAYEVSDPNSTKAYRNEGMKVEYLRCLAEFYEVSVDYLLGYTNDQDRQPSLIDDLGLSQKAVGMIRRLKDLDDYQEALAGLNMILEGGNIAFISQDICRLKKEIECETTSLKKSILGRSKSSGEAIANSMEVSLTENKLSRNIETKILELHPELRGRAIHVSLGENCMTMEIKEIISAFEFMVREATGFNNYESIKHGFTW